MRTTFVNRNDPADFWLCGTTPVSNEQLNKIFRGGTTPVSNEQLNKIFRGTLRSDFKHIISLVGILYGPVALFGFRLPIISSISVGFVGLR